MLYINSKSIDKVVILGGFEFVCTITVYQTPDRVWVGRSGAGSHSADAALAAELAAYLEAA